MDVGVVGGSGYGGAELLRLLAGHPSFKIRTIGAGRSAGRDLAEVFPHLGMSGPLAPAHPEAFEGCDVVFLATPDEVSLELAPALSGGVGLVVDLSAAFRLDAGVYERTYARPHTAAALTPAPYGLPELFRDGLPGRTLVAGPGCYPTAALLALAPLAGLVDPASVVIAGLSGTSGAGRGLRDDLHASHAVGNVSVYGAPSHRHTPEIEAGWAALAALDEVAPVTFTPHLVPLSRGLHCTVTAMLCDPAADVRAACLDRYDAEPFVTVLPPGVWPSTTHLRGGNAAHVGAAVDGRTGRVTVACAIDNLGKGAAGQAIQAANAVLGLPETSGLPIAGVYP